jgi:hypothetical protein
VDVGGILELIEPMEWLTIGLVVFAGAQVWLQERAERQRRAEKAAEQSDAIDRAFQFVWTEHFRLVSLRDDLRRRDLIEMAYLGVLDPKEVLPRDFGRLTEALTGLSPEAGFLGAVAIALCHDIERAMGILLKSVAALAQGAPPALTAFEKVQWLRKQFGDDIAPWEEAVRTGVAELALLMWDAARHNPRIDLERSLQFSDNLSSGFAKAAAEALLKRSTGVTPSSDSKP